MRTIKGVLAAACLAVSACGGGSSGDDQALLAELMVQEDSFGFMDEECVREKTAELSDEDARILIENIDADDIEGLGLSDDAEAWVFSLLACVGDEFDVSEDDTALTVIDGAPEGVVGDRSAPVPAGQIADVGRGWRLQVIDVTEDGTAAVMAANEYNDPPPEGSRFTLVEVVVGYYGSDWGTPPFISAVGAANVELESYCGFLPDELGAYDSLFGGGVITGNLCWVTTPDDEGQVQIYASANFSGDDVFLEVVSPSAAADVMPSMKGPQPGTDDAEARNDPVALGTPSDIGEGWQVTVTGPASDVTDAVLAANDFNDPPPDGYRYIGFDVSLEFGEDRTASGFEVDIDVVGDSNITLSNECGDLTEPLDLFTDVFNGAVLTGTVCFVTPVGDVGTLVAFASASFGDPTFLAVEG